jgi:hypothetical protein
LFAGFIDASEQLDFTRNLFQWGIFRKLGNQLDDHFAIAHNLIISKKRLVCNRSPRAFSISTPNALYALDTEMLEQMYQLTPFAHLAQTPSPFCGFFVSYASSQARLRGQSSVASLLLLAIYC